LVKIEKSLIHEANILERKKNEEKEKEITKMIIYYLKWLEKIWNFMY
jgi:hypothetical protein